MGFVSFVGANCLSADSPGALVGGLVETQLFFGQVAGNVRVNTFYFAGFALESGKQFTAENIHWFGIDGIGAVAIADKFQQKAIVIGEFAYQLFLFTNSLADLPLLAAIELL